MFGFIPRAESLSLSNLSPWVDGFYPFGYPLLLRLVFLVIGDYEIAGRILALASAIVTILMVVRTALSLFHYRIALFTIALCVSNPLFMRYATMSGTDMPAVSLLMVFLSNAVSFSITNRNKHLLLSGLALGAAYLIRYTALPLLPAMLAWLVIADRKVSLKERLGQAILFLSFFIIAAFPQFVLSTIVKGNPLWNLQARNVFFGMYGQGNWKNWFATEHIESIREVISPSFINFLRHWYSTAKSIFLIDLVQYPLWLLAGAGALLSLKHPVQRISTLLILTCVSTYVIVISMAFIDTRLLLFCTPILLMYSAYGGWIVMPARLPIAFLTKYHIKVLLLIVLVSGLVWFHMRPMWLEPLSPHDEGRIIVSSALHAMQQPPEPKEVLALAFDYYDLSRPTKDRYSIDWFNASFIPYTSVNDIAGRMKGSGQRFLVFNRFAPRDVRGLDQLWPFDSKIMNTFFERIQIPTESVSLYRLRESNTKACRFPIE